MKPLPALLVALASAAVTALSMMSLRSPAAPVEASVTGNHQVLLTSTIAELSEQEGEFSRELTERVNELSKRIVDAEASAEFFEAKWRDAKRELAIAESALMRKDERIAAVEAAYRDAKDDSARVGSFLLERTPAVVSEVSITDTSEIAHGTGVSTPKAWQYPQPIQPTEWIQQTLSPPPSNPKKAWDRIRGK